MSRLLSIKTIKEFQEHYPLTFSENGFDRLERFIHIAQRDYIVPVIGQELLDNLLEYHNASDGSGSGDSESGSGSGGTSDSCLASLLPYVQDAVASLAIFEGFSQLEISVGPNGIVQNSNDNEKQAIYSSQRVNAKRDILRQGMNAVEEILVFLELNKDKECFKDWAESDERTDNLGHILPTAKIFTEYWSNLANKRLTYMALKSRMIDVEMNVVRPLLGKELFAELMGQLTGTVSEANEELLIFLRPMVAKYTAARGMPELSLHIEAFGVFHNLTEKNERSTEVTVNAKDSRLYDVQEKLNQEADMHRQDLVDHLNDNVADYPLFKTSKAYIETDDETDDDTETGSGGIVSRL